MRALIGLWLLGLLVILELAFEEFLLRGGWGPEAARMIALTRQTRRDCISIMRKSPKKILARLGTLLKIHALCMWVLFLCFLKRHGFTRLFKLVDAMDFWVRTVIFREKLGE